MVAPVRFGTDGIRGRAYEEITVDLAYRLGRAVASVFSVPVFVGYDTRESSPELAAAVLAGLRDGGAVSVNLGYFTTPGVAVIARQRGGAGVVVSASHNPYYDNGLKVLGLGGTKLDHATEDAVTLSLNGAGPAPSPSFDEPAVDESAEHDYADHLRSLVPSDLSALHLAIDCANGAASHVARQPDGRNINENCGSMHPEDLIATVLEVGADLGLAFDGDADRLISVDASGTVRDGDDLMTLFAMDFKSRNLLGGGLVVTSMSNLGLHRALAKSDISIVEVDVGDRNVLIALEDRSWPFGGEQSGHLIFRNLAPTGDGMLTGLMLCDLVVRHGPLERQASEAWQRVPQALVNIARESYDEETVMSIFEELRARFEVQGVDVRLLIRPSGTEPVVRVMVEALNGDFVDQFRSRLLASFPS